MKPLKRANLLASGPNSKPLYSVKISTEKKSYDVASPTHIRGLIALMDMQAVLGGAASHFGGPSAFAEINASLHALVFDHGPDWKNKFNLVNDAGHCENGLYALKALYGYADLSLSSLKGFRSIESKLTGHGESHLFPEAVLLSNGPLGSAVAQAQGLAVADKLIGNQRTTILTISDGACMEGEAKEAFASIPGLAKQGKQNPFIMIVSDNNTKLSGRIDEDAFSMEPTFKSLENLGWKVVSIPEGHNLKKCLTAISEAIDNIKSNQPWVLHVKTIKGYGHKASEEAASGGHGFPLKKAEELDSFLKEVFGEQEIPAEFNEWKEELKTFKSDEEEFSFRSDKLNWLKEQKSEKIQVGVAKALIEYKEKGFPIVSVTSDLPGSTGVAAFIKKFPESSIDVGVAESNMVSLAAGLSKTGLIPVVDTFAQFGVTKGALPLTMANLSGAPIISVFSHTGFQDAADGASHQALSYFSMTASIPGTRVFALSSSEEAYQIMGFALEDFKKRMENNEELFSYVFFLGRENFKPNFNSSKTYDFMKSQVLVSSEKPMATVVAAGSMVEQAFKAYDILSSKGQSIDVINPSCLNLIDLKPILDSLKKSDGYLITMEDHQSIAGFGHHLVAEITKVAPGLIKKLKVFGVNGEFGQSAYQAQQLYDKHNMGYSSLLNLFTL